MECLNGTFDTVDVFVEYSAEKRCKVDEHGYQQISTKETLSLLFSSYSCGQNHSSKRRQIIIGCVVGGIILFVIIAIIIGIVFRRKIPTIIWKETDEGIVGRRGKSENYGNLTEMSYNVKS